jgi:hypothetical protein
LAKNTHLTHIEDRIITDGAKGAYEAIEMLKLMGDFLDGKAGGGKPLVTEKWDGAPAVICGTDPSDGQFFVGTKSVFAKNQPKLCKSVNDINRWYSGVLAKKLIASFNYLNGRVQGVLQGDLMFTDDKRHESIEGQPYVSFRPNTLTYAAKKNTPLGKQIENAKLGIVFHTKYTGSDMANMSASFNVGPGDYQSGGDVWAQRATYQDISGAANMTPVERAQYDKAVRRAEGSVKRAVRMMNKIQSGKKTLMADTELLKFFNNYVKVGRDIPSVDKAYNQFLFHLGAETDKEVNKRQTTASQEKLAMKWLGTVDMIENNKSEFKMLIAAYMNIQYCKNILVRQLQKVQGLRIFADMGNKYVAANPEGYVAVRGQRAVKLIDRLDFSRLNFTIPKQWDK